MGGFSKGGMVFIGFLFNNLAGSLFFQMGWMWDGGMAGEMPDLQERTTLGRIVDVCLMLKHFHRSTRCEGTIYSLWWCPSSAGGATALATA